MTTSLHELFASDIKPRTRFVEHFSGDALDTLRWEAYGQGTETISMTDDGLSLQGGSNDNDSAGIGFGGTIGGTQTMRPFNCRGSKIIFIQKFSANGEYQASESGFDKQLRPDAFGGVASGAGLITSHHNTNSKWVLRTANGSDYSGSTNGGIRTAGVAGLTTGTSSGSQNIERITHIWNDWSWLPVFRLGSIKNRRRCKNNRKV